MKRLKSTLAIVLSIVCLLSLLAGCGGNKGSADTLVVAQTSDIISLDPHKTNDSFSSTAIVQIYDCLVDLDTEMNIVPGIATEWYQVDDTTWEFKLREGVKFHNGDELKASDVKFTFDRHIDPETAAPAAFMLSSLESVEIIDDYTVRFHTTEPCASLPYNLTHDDMAILSEKAVTEAGDAYGENPVGTGPFKFVSWTKNQEMVLERFDDYYQGPAALSKIVIRIIPESATAIAELKTGGVDIVLNLSSQYASQFSEGSGLVLEQFPVFTAVYLSFDMRQEPFDNVLVRQAINYAIDKESIIKMAYGGYAEELVGPLPPQVHGASQDLEGYTYDVEKAKELLTEAGYPDGFSTTLYVDTDEVNNKVATVIQSQLKEINIDVQLQVLEWGAFLEQTAQGLPMFLLSWTTVTADADNGMYALFHSSAQGSQGNRTFYANERVDELLDSARAEFDEEARLAMYAEASQIIVDDAAWASLVVKQYLVGMNDKVQGFVPMPTTFFDYYTVSKTE